MKCIVGLILAFYIRESCTTKTTVSIYYESLGTHSVRFIVDQFYPAYVINGKKIKVDLVPFGKAIVSNSTGRWKISCRHGPMECYGNKVQACVIALNHRETSTDFVVCAMKSGDASLDANLEQCANDNNITWSSIQQCIRSGQGDEFLVWNGVRTISKEPKITYIPTVIFNNVYDEVLQRLSLKDFEEIVEFLVKESDCKTCRKTNGSKQINLPRVVLLGCTFLILLSMYI